MYTYKYKSERKESAINEIRRGSTRINWRQGWKEKKDKKRIPLERGKQFREKRAARVGPGSIRRRFTELSSSSSSPPPWYPWRRDSNGRRGRRGACVRCAHYNWISPRGKKDAFLLLTRILDSSPSRWKILVKVSKIKKLPSVDIYIYA